MTVIGHDLTFVCRGSLLRILTGACLVLRVQGLSESVAVTG